ncbi:LCP family protein [Streptomyces sp. NBRC 110611]|uniref:LCP family protein n=1 Tax=Streptomyces sp. NBRC 110611 TaxID=1621259 RepID=UPI0008349BD8|nr:LCP family protein [Streptomyces sp. NBRC 110611]
MALTSPKSGSPTGLAAGRRCKRPTGHLRILANIVCALGSCLVVSGAVLGILYFRLNNNLNSVDINTTLRKDRPQETLNGSMNILVLGSDSRAGFNSKYGEDKGSARSDTTMVVHIYRGHKRASVVSIPRDTLISRPDCISRNGKIVKGRKRDMFNHAYEIGGPVCAVKTVESMSGTRMNHFIEIDFTGFRRIVDALGGVEITTTKSIRDKYSHLVLSSGTHRLTGEEALGLVRTRHAAPGGDGSDLARIQLQQIFIKAMMKQAKSVGLLGGPMRLYEIADAMTKAVNTDDELSSVKQLMELAKSLIGIAPQDLKMLTLPVTFDPLNKNRVAPLPQQSKRVWDALRNDQAIPVADNKRNAAKYFVTDGQVQPDQ